MEIKIERYLFNKNTVKKPVTREVTGFSYFF